MEEIDPKRKKLSITIDLSKLFMQALGESEEGFRDSVLQNRKKSDDGIPR